MSSWYGIHFTQTSITPIPTLTTRMSVRCNGWWV